MRLQVRHNTTGPEALLREAPSEVDADVVALLVVLEARVTDAQTERYLPRRPQTSSLHQQKILSVSYR